MMGDSGCFWLMGDMRDLCAGGEDYVWERIGKKKS